MAGGFAGELLKILPFVGAGAQGYVQGEQQAQEWRQLEQAMLMAQKQEGRASESHEMDKEAQGWRRDQAAEDKATAPLRRKKMLQDTATPTAGATKAYGALTGVNDLDPTTLREDSVMSRLFAQQGKEKLEDIRSQARMRGVLMKSQQMDRDWALETRSQIVRQIGDIRQEIGSMSLDRNQTEGREDTLELLTSQMADLDLIIRGGRPAPAPGQAGPGAGAPGAGAATAGMTPEQLKQAWKDYLAGRGPKPGP